MFFHPGSPDPITTEEFSALRSEWYQAGMPTEHPYLQLEKDCRPRIISPLVRLA